MMAGSMSPGAGGAGGRQQGTHHIEPSHHTQATACRTAAADRPSRRITHSPQRVPIIRPSRGVSPMVVSTLRPAATAHIELPAPRWHSTRLHSPAGLPSSAAARPVRYR